MAVLHKLKENPWYLAAGIVLLVIVWMATGSFAVSETGEELATEQANKLPEVRARQQQAEAVQRFVTVYGRSEPARTVTLKAETVGKITSINTERGRYVEAGTDLITIDVRDRQEQLQRARAEVEKARIQYEAEQSLQGDGLTSNVRIAEAMAALETAKAELKRIRIDLDKTTVEAPFSGSLQERFVEVGDYVKVGDPVAEFVDINTLIITGSISEIERAHLEAGSEASARLITGQVANGIIRYIAPVADEETRTFLVEIEVDNSDRTLPAGVTAEISLPLGETLAHKVSPAILTLDSNGNIGIKTVDGDGKVVFTRANIVKSTDDGVWIDGLPAKANIITVGQGFVKPGEKVKAVYEEAPQAALAKHVGSEE